MTYEEYKKRLSQKTRPHKTVQHKEDDLQIRCVEWFRNSYPELSPLLFHPNNEAYFGAHKTQTQREIAGKRAKDKGVVPGVADLILLYPGAQHHALCIELKTKTGRQSDSQKQWQKAVEAFRFKYAIIKSLPDFKRIIEEFTQLTPKDATQAKIEAIFGKSVKIHRR